MKTPKKNDKKWSNICLFQLRATVNAGTISVKMKNAQWQTDSMVVYSSSSFWAMGPTFIEIPNGSSAPEDLRGCASCNCIIRGVWSRR